MAEAAFEPTDSDKEFYAKEFTEHPVDLDCPEHGVNLWILGSARRLWQRSYSDREIIDLLHKATRGVRHRKVGRDEIVRAVEKVIGTALPEQRKGEARRKEVVYDPEILRERAGQISEVVDEAWLEARSAFTCWNRTPAGFLHKVYFPTEKVWLTVNTKSGDGKFWTHQGYAQDFGELNFFIHGHQGVWFLINPLSGDLRVVERCKSKYNPEGLSFTTLESTTAWRYGMVESDEAPRDLWLKAMVQIELPVVAIYDSGKRSVHVLIRFDAGSMEQLKAVMDRYEDELVRLGACRGSLTPRRLSRLPNCVREETGQLQRLLYLRPNADNTPICQIPPREPPGALETRIRATHAGVIHNYESPEL